MDTETEYSAAPGGADIERLPTQPEALVSASMASASQVISPKVRTVNPGDRVNIPCSLANMGGSIQFAKDNQPIILDSGCAHCQLDISNDGQASLTINRVSQKDQGHWQCWRLDSNGNVKQKIPIIQLIITDSPELPILVVNDKELLGGNNNLDATITVKENEIVTFKCVIKGAKSPVDYVHWILDSSQNVTHLSQLVMTTPTNQDSDSSYGYLTQSILKLNATKSMNLKTISCLSNHHLWLTPMTVTAFMNVLYEPSFTISREPGFGIPVTEGMKVTLKCEIDSNPISQPIWIKDADNKTATDEQQASQQQQQQVQSAKESSEPIVLDTQDDGSVIFAPAQRQDSGWYRCKTENKYGNFSSFGYYLNVRPQNANSQQQVGTSSSDQQQVANLKPQSRFPQPNLQRHPVGDQQNQQNYQPPARVMAPNQPAAQVIGRLPFNSHNMINNDQPASVSPPSPSSSSSVMGNLANLFNSQNLHQPNYPSTSSSSLAATSASSQCKGNRLEGFPEIDQPVSTVQAVLGRQLVLPLRFCCNPGPARVFWIHRHLALIPGRMFGPYITRDIYTTYNSFYCYESTFEIESVKPEDIGTVYVFVSNEKGHAGAQIHIQLARGSQGQNEQQSLFGSRFQLAGSSAASGSSLPRNMELRNFFNAWPWHRAQLMLTLLVGAILPLVLGQQQLHSFAWPTATLRR